MLNSYLDRNTIEYGFLRACILTPNDDDDDNTDKENDIINIVDNSDNHIMIMMIIMLIIRNTMMIMIIITIMNPDTDTNIFKDDFDNKVIYTCRR